MTKRIEYERSLLAKRPDLAAEWHCGKNGVLTPMDFSEFSNKKVWWECRKGHSWEAAISNRVVEKGCPFCGGKRVILGETDLKTRRPELASEWDYDKNGTLTPECMAEHSNKKVWWKCEKGHSWEAIINDRVAKGYLCPYCSGQRVIIGETDLKTKRPDLAIEWDYKKNGDLKPDDVAIYSSKKVWWICEKKHSWKAVVHGRTKGSGCPYCSGKKAIIGETDLKTRRPDLASEWDSEKNGDLKPDDVTAYSSKKAWWICKKKHSWEAAIYSRTSGCGCPYCSGRRAIVGVTDLETQRPDLVCEWDYSKNGVAIPTGQSQHSNKKVWWKCKYGHSWKTANSSRVAGGKCPFCSGKRVIVGENDLKTLRLDLASEWNHDKNGELAPDDVTVYSNKKVWWTCKKGHSWEAVVAHRVRGNGCPFCSGRKAIAGENDLMTMRPDLASEWDYEKNGELKPDNLTEHSEKRVFWICAMQHKWHSPVFQRSKGVNCPYCSGKRKAKVNSDLANVSCHAETPHDDDCK